MPGKKDPRPSVKDEGLYEALREEGNSKEKSARIANAAAATSRSRVGRKGGYARNYEERTLQELQERARELGIEGRSTMNKAELIQAMQQH